VISRKVEGPFITHYECTHPCQDTAFFKAWSRLDIILVVPIATVWMQPLMTLVRFLMLAQVAELAQRYEVAWHYKIPYPRLHHSKQTRHRDIPQMSNTRWVLKWGKTNQLLRSWQFHGPELITFFCKGTSVT
jgi:hypothetical protein